MHFMWQTYNQTHDTEKILSISYQQRFSPFFIKLWAANNIGGFVKMCASLQKMCVVK